MEELKNKGFSIQQAGVPDERSKYSLQMLLLMLILCDILPPVLLIGMVSNFIVVTTPTFAITTLSADLSCSNASAESSVVRRTESSKRTTCVCPQLCGVRTVRCGLNPSNGASASSSGLSSVDRRAVRIAVRLRRPSVSRGHFLSARH